VERPGGGRAGYSGLTRGGQEIFTLPGQKKEIIGWGPDHHGENLEVRDGASNAGAKDTDTGSVRLGSLSK